MGGGPGGVPPGEPGGGKGRGSGRRAGGPGVPLREAGRVVPGKVPE